MAHGHEDFHRKAEVYITADDIDLNELAARLGSIVTFERHGKALILDDFEASLLKWLISAAGVGASVGLSSEWAKNGAQSVKIVTSAVPGQDSHFYRTFGYPSSNRYGVEISFSPWSKSSYVRLRVVFRLAGTFWVFELKIRVTESEIYYFDDQEAWVLAYSGSTLDTSDRNSYTLKLVFNPTLGEYVRAIFNNTILDLSGIAGYSAPTVWNDYIWVGLFTGTEATAGKTAYFDDFIFTYDEPEEV